MLYAIVCCHDEARLSARRMARLSPVAPKALTDLLKALHDARIALKRGARVAAAKVSQLDDWARKFRKFASEHKLADFNKQSLL